MKPPLGHPDLDFLCNNQYFVYPLPDILPTILLEDNEPLPGALYSVPTYMSRR